MKYPTGVLINEATGRFHPISFRLAPLPSSGGIDAYSEAEVQRYKSIGHHTVGFDTEDEAHAFIAEQDQMKECGLVWKWDGTDIPAMLGWFKPSEFA